MYVCEHVFEQHMKFIFSAWGRKTWIDGIGMISEGDGGQTMAYNKEEYIWFPGRKAAFEVEGQLDNKSYSRESEERVCGE